MTQSLTQQYMNQITEAVGQPDLELPPPSFLELDGEVTAFEDGQSLTLRYPIPDRYLQPMGFLQGGFLAAMMDNCLGPLSFTLGPPSVTADLNIQYVRPVLGSEDYVEVKGWLVDRTRSRLMLTAEARKPNGKIAARATASCLFVSAPG